MTSPTARALLALELIQGSPGITAERLADKLGVSERAARRYVGILREAGIPIDSVRGPYGGYRVGRGLRLPPLMFSAAEALGLVMAVLDGHHDAGDPTDPVGSALGKIVRALPEPVAAQAEARPPDHRTGARPCRRPARPGHHDRPGAGLRGSTGVSGSTTAPRPARTGASRSSRGRSSCGTAAGTCCAGRPPGRPACLPGRPGRGRSRLLDDTFAPPTDLDPVAVLEEHLRRRLGVRRRGRHRRARRRGRPLRPACPRPARSRRRARPRGWSAAPATRCGTPSSWPSSRRRSTSGGPELQQTTRELGQRLLDAGASG